MINRKKQSIYGFKYVFLFTAAVLLIHIFYLASLPYDLYADEAQYWSWSKSLDWGYFSKPPMIAWVIAGTTKFCGDGEFCVRLGAPILHFFTAILMYLIGTRLFTKRVGFWSSVVYSTLPGVTVSSYIISTDAPLLFFWALSFYALIRGLKDWHIKWWILLGIAAGFGMLSKYTMVMFYASAGLYFIISKENRVYLFSFKFWLAILISVAVYWKNFAWNQANNFASYNHTKDNADLYDISLNFNKMLEFVGAQFGVVGPIFFALLLFYIFFRFTNLIKRDHNKFLLCFILPFLLLITTISLLSRAHANWAVPVYIAGTIFVVSLVTARGTVLVKSLVWINIFAAVGFYHYHKIPDIIDKEMTVKLDPFYRLKGQKELGEAISKELKNYPSAAILTTDRRTHSTLLYYARDNSGNIPRAAKWNSEGDVDDHFELTADIKNRKGEDFILVSKFDDVKDIEKNRRS